MIELYNLNEYDIYMKKIRRDEKMDNSLKFQTLREKYKEFIFEDYEIEEIDDQIVIKYKFEIPNLTGFNPEIKIPKKKLKLRKIEGSMIQNLVFHIGLIELISYWKCTCSPNVIIKCGFLNEEQKAWFKKLYFNGLGELLFTNEIKTNIDDFMNITCLGEELKEDTCIEENSRILNTNWWRKRFSCNFRNFKN